MTDQGTVIMEKIRIQKYFTDCGIMSRRAAETAVAAGRVTVNGVTALTGQKINPEADTVTLDGKQVTVPENRQKTYIMLNKPRGYVTTASDEKGRPCVTELVAGCGVRVYPVGRLDMDSEGLLLLTDDGELTYRLTHPKHEIPKLYHVSLRGAVTDAALERLSAVRELDGYSLAPVTIGLLSRNEDTTIIEMTLREGRNRQIRRMCEAAGLTITRLRRVALGALRLGDIASGKWCYLSRRQIDYLYGKEQL